MDNEQERLARVRRVLLEQLRDRFTRPAVHVAIGESNKLLGKVVKYVNKMPASTVQARERALLAPLLARKFARSLGPGWTVAVTPPPRPGAPTAAADDALNVALARIYPELLERFQARDLRRIDVKCRGTAIMRPETLVEHARRLVPILEQTCRDIGLDPPLPELELPFSWAAVAIHRRAKHRSPALDELSYQLLGWASNLDPRSVRKRIIRGRRLRRLGLDVF